ncbi:uncharacterized protein LOC132200852 [Neocloeon triangulifer]|uniref:uncharacterized protein LOC132200852 n=1 Tax=Neocloeon triangulifer TaxID=2078957 RepID=UPI00286F2908|nr:uncharacterized protein LOC132200852 [Neocloeon triangulifer]XP_059482587.1 uncharacterized protein LOC132200852 [Neocloeon triangulifer]
METSSTINESLKNGDLCKFEVAIKNISIENSREILNQICSSDISDDNKCRFANALLAKYNIFQRSAQCETQWYPLHECAKLGKHGLLSILLNHPRHPADVQELNGESKTAVHCAVEGAVQNYDDDERNKEREINALRCIKLLYDKNCYLNARDSRGFTAVHTAAEKGLWQLVSYFLLRNVNIDIKVQNTNARELIQKEHAKWISAYPTKNFTPPIPNSPDEKKNLICTDGGGDKAAQPNTSAQPCEDFERKILSILQPTKNNQVKSMSSQEWEKLFRDSNAADVDNCKDKILEHFIKNDKEEAACILLDEPYKADPSSSLYSAVEAGQKYLKLIIENWKNSTIDFDIKQTSINDEQTLLHKAVTCKEVSIETVKYLLELGKKLSPVDFHDWINARDNRPLGYTSPTKEGYTALQYAVRGNRNDVIQLLLQYGANVFMTYSESRIPTLNCIKPEVIEEHFSNQIKVSDNGKMWFEKEYCITLDFNIFKSNVQVSKGSNNDQEGLPSRFQWPPLVHFAQYICSCIPSVPTSSSTDPNSAGVTPENTGCSFRASQDLEAGGHQATTTAVTEIENGAGNSQSASANVGSERGPLLGENPSTELASQGNTNDKENRDNALTNFTLEMEPLKMIADSQAHEILLLHPLIKIFFHLKWNRLYWFFWVNLLLYLLFTISFFIFVIFSDFVKGNANNKTREIDNSENDFTPSNELYEFIAKIAVWITFAFNVLLTLRELFQFFFLQGYLGKKENYLELTIIFATFFLPFFSRCKILVSILSLLISLELMHLISRHPKVTIYIQMLSVVSKNSLKLLGWYCPLIIAFGFSFYVIFPVCAIGKNCNDSFDNWLKSIFKAMVMISGEYEAGQIDFEFTPIASHMLFILFLFFVTIVMINLLNSVAVSDIQMIKEKAELIFCKYQATFYSDIETTLVASYKWKCMNNLLSSKCFKILQFLDNLLFSNVNKVQIYPNKKNQVETDVSYCGNRVLPREMLKSCDSFHSLAAEAIKIAQQNNTEVETDVSYCGNRVLPREMLKSCDSFHSLAAEDIKIAQQNNTEVDFFKNQTTQEAESELKRQSPVKATDQASPGPSGTNGQQGSQERQLEENDDATLDTANL